VQKMNYSGPTIYAGQSCYLKLANYHTPFGLPSSVIHDRIVRGTSQSDVSPTPLKGVAKNRKLIAPSITVVQLAHRIGRGEG
jgi:hypothetical protein